jgi:hypothetical protein
MEHIMDKTLRIVAGKRRQVKGWMKIKKKKLYKVIGIIHYLWRWNTFILSGELRVPWVGNTSISIVGKSPKLILQEKMMTPWPSSGMVIILGGHGNCSLLPTTELCNPWSWESLLQSGGGSEFWFQVWAMSCHFKNQEKSIVEEWNSLTNLGLNSGPFQN